MENEIHVIEVGEINRDASIILGVPDIGLVGTIATTHLLEELNLKEVGFLESDLFPPITVVHDHVPKSPVRLYGNKDIIVLVSEMPIPPSLIRPFSNFLVSWFKEKGFTNVITIGGIARQDRIDIENPAIFALPSDETVVEMLKKQDISIFEEGLLVGFYGTVMRACIRKGIHSVYLMGESHIRYPDPGAAASAIEAINKILDLKVDVNSLKEKSEEIRLKARDLMKRTGTALEELEKTQEQEMPMMYR